MILLPDTRPYPTDPIKNELLLYAKQIAHNQTGHSLAKTQLHSKITEMLRQNQYLSLSVALSMAADAASYAALMDSLDNVLQANHHDEIQWFALPIVIVAGSKQATTLNPSIPSMALTACLANYPNLRPLSHAQWLPHLIRADTFAQIKANQWFDAKQNLQNAQAFAHTLHHTNALSIPEGQSVHVVYALGYGDSSLKTALGKPLHQAALPLMHIWQNHWHTPQLTLFCNPLNANTPLNALTDANHTRLRMALDVFAANAIRAIRLHSARVGVVMAARQGGQLAFGFSAVDDTYGLSPQVFTWPLSPRENIGIVQQQFIDLMVDCQVEQLYQLNHVLADDAPFPTFAAAQQWSGLNPLFSSQPHD